MELPSINQLWVTYVTYIWLETEFVDLAATLDVYSRSVIGWALDRTLDASLAEGRSTCLKIAPGKHHLGSLAGWCRIVRTVKH